jgi:hypothetical protein
MKPAYCRRLDVVGRAPYHRSGGGAARRSAAFEARTPVGEPKTRQANMKAIKSPRLAVGDEAAIVAGDPRGLRIYAALRSSGQRNAGVRSRLLVEERTWGGTTFGTT